MESLPLHIEFLLTRHDCVIVPGLGAFIAVETEGAFDEAEGIVRPRRREISFNGSVVSDDGLLAHSIARRERISYEDAHRRLVLMTARMKQELHLEGETGVGRVGKLLMDAEGIISFEPRISKAETDILPEIKLHKTEAVNSAKTAGTDSKDNIGNIQESDGSRMLRVAPDVYVFTVSKRLAHAAAMIAMVVGICLSLLIPINHDMEQRASVMPVEVLLRPLENQNPAPSNETDSLEMDLTATETPYMASE